MLSNIGNFLLILNILLSFLIIYSSLNCLKSSDNFISKNIYRTSLVQSTFIIVCFFSLISAFIVSEKLDYIELFKEISKHAGNDLIDV